MLSLPRRTDQGEGSISYVAVVLLIAVIIGALVVSPLPVQVSGGTTAAVCEVTGGECAADRHVVDASRESGSPGQVNARQGESIISLGRLERTYKKAYKKAVEAAEKETKEHQWPPLSEIEKYQIGKRAGAEAIRKEFRAGRVLNSVTGKPYTDYYGNAWDRGNGSNRSLP